MDKKKDSKDSDLYKLDKQIVTMTKEKNKVEQLNGKVQLVNEQVEAWCKRIIDKIDQQFNENIGSYTDKTMAFSFAKIT